MPRGSGVRRLQGFAPIAQWAAVSVASLAVLVLASILTAAPALAQRYAPDYPVCLQTYGIAGNNIDCHYLSLAQCGGSASGLPAQCIVNPYFAGTEFAARERGPRHRRSY
jgi:hypothetical protein